MGARRCGRAQLPVACPTASTPPTPRRRCSTCARTRAPASCSSRTRNSSTRCSTVRERLPLLHRIIVFDMEGLRDFKDPQVIEPGGAARARARIHASTHPGSSRARCRVQGRRPGDPGLHLGHDRQTQGCDAFPRGLVYSVRGYNQVLVPRDGRRTHVFPAAVPHRRAAGSASIRDLHRRGAELRREPRNGAGKRARDRAHRVHRRAAGMGEVLLGGGDRAAPKPSGCSRRCTPGRIGVGHALPSGCWPGGRARALKAAVHAGPLAGAGQRAQIDRHPPCALFA